MVGQIPGFPDSLAYVENHGRPGYEAVWTVLVSISPTSSYSGVLINRDCDCHYPMFTSDSFFDFSN